MCYDNPMPITLTCTCGQQQFVAETLAGKTGTCVACGKALTVPAMVASGAMKIEGLSAVASDIIEHRARAVTTLARATRDMIAMPYSVFGAMVYESGSAEGRSADDGFSKSISDADSRLDEAAKLLPDESTDILNVK